jgi:hypothetical protein
MTPEPDLEPDRPRTREQEAIDLAVGAATNPFNIAALVVALVAPLLLGAPLPVAVVVAFVVYTAVVARTLFR